MGRYQELLAEKAALVTEAKGVFAKAATEKRELNEAERKRDDEIQARLESVNDAITREERQRDRERGMPTIEDKPKAETVQPFGKGPRGLGEQLMAVANFARGNGLDPRLAAIKAAASGLNETIPSEGGFLVQTDFAAELLKDTYNTNEIPNRCRRIPISGPSNAFSMNVIDETSRATGSRWGGVTVYHETEGASMSGLGSKPKFAKLDMKLEKIMGLCYATDENMQDAAQLGAIIAQAFPEEFGFVLSDDIYRGDGAGKCLGILNSPALVTVAKETGQAADTVCTENILKMWKSRRGRNLVWFYNQELEDQLDTLTLSIGTGGVEMRLFQPPTGNSPYGTIKGVPAIPVEVASGPGDVGDILLADMSQYLLIDKGGIQTAESMHVAFLTGENVFRFTYRVNGQPLRKNKVTPYKRTDSNFYVSPFVTLAAR
jgi:HK97 family phage major capsid protein